ncbi:MAG: hypothetical protein HYV67_03985 [Candidatus Taylorbacteria bacterium]|nr:hypothetical protein [Candidatus Taylorbacteria bacterium]
MTPAKKEPLVWETFEYVYREKSADWYWAVSIIAVSMAVTSVLFNNVLFAIFIALSFFTLMLYAKRKPHLLQIRLDERGIQEGRARHPYSSIESFWVESRFGDFKIIIKSKNKASPYIIIPIEDVNADEVRNHLKKYLPEEEHSEPLAKRIMEYLGF